MKIIKKLLLSVSFFLPLISFSCSTKEPQLITKEPLVDDDDKDKKTENKLPVVITIEQPPVFVDKIKDINGKKDTTKEGKDLQNNTKEPTILSEEKIIGELEEIYQDIYRVYEPFTKSGVFAPKEWLEEDQETIKEQYRQKDIDTFNITFFSNYYPYLEDIKQEKWLAARYARITTKDDFDTYIIEKFKELNKSNEYNESTKIKKLFEELYLNNKDAYDLLKSNDIFIKTVSGNSTEPRGSSIIPIYDNQSVTITSIEPHDSDLGPAPIPDVYNPDPSRVWRVFLIKKKFTVQYRDIKRDKDTSVIAFGRELINWYKNLFLKQYPQT